MKEDSKLQEMEPVDQVDLTDEDVAIIADSFMREIGIPLPGGSLIGPLNKFHLSFPRAGWIVRWYYDGVAQLQTIHLRVEENATLWLQAPAQRLMVLIELDNGRCMCASGLAQ